MFSESSLLASSGRPAIARDVSENAAPRRFLGWLWARCAQRLRPSASALRIEDRLMLGGRKSVTLIACGGRRFLLASSGDALAPLLEVRPLRPPSAAGLEPGSENRCGSGSGNGSGNGWGNGSEGQQGGPPR